MKNRDDIIKARDALAIAKSLTRKYLSLIDFSTCDDRQITELREIHYHTHEAIMGLNKVIKDEQW